MFGQQVLLERRSKLVAVRFVAAINRTATRTMSVVGGEQRSGTIAQNGTNVVSEVMTRRSTGG